MINHACEYCGKIKQYKSQSLVKRFCSHKCSNQWKWDNIRKHADSITLICPKCNKNFSIPISQYNVRKKRTKTIYCSRQCYLDSICLQNKICKGCGIVFLPKDNRVNFCSKQCYQNYAKLHKLRTKTGYWLENGYKVLYNNGNPIKEHIFIMEQYLGRTLEENEVVHHINGNKLDNNIDNLQLLSREEHSRLHRQKELRDGKKLFGR